MGLIPAPWLAKRVGDPSIAQQKQAIASKRRTGEVSQQAFQRVTIVLGHGCGRVQAPAEGVCDVRAARATTEAFGVAIGIGVGGLVASGVARLLGGVARLLENLATVDAGQASDAERAAHACLDRRRIGSRIRFVFAIHAQQPAAPEVSERALVNSEHDALELRRTGSPQRVEVRSLIGSLTG